MFDVLQLTPLSLAFGFPFASEEQKKPENWTKQPMVFQVLKVSEKPLHQEEAENLAARDKEGHRKVVPAGILDGLLALESVDLPAGKQNRLTGVVESSIISSWL